MTEKTYWRCGACGNLYRHDNKLITSEEFELIKLDVDCDISYCGCEDDFGRDRVTRDMAIDAGDLSLEGELI